MIKISNVRIKGHFYINIPENTIADALMLSESDREIQLQSDGNRMHILS